MDTDRMIARMVGVLYIIGTVSGILSVVLSASLLDVSDYLAKIAENDTRMIIAALCVLTMGLSLALIPIVAFPVLRKQSETLALGYIVFRGALETLCYLMSVLGMLLLVPISQEYVKASGADISGYQSVGTLLERAPDYIGSLLSFVFLSGAGMFYTVLYQSRLVPRWLSGWGLVSIVPALAAAILALSGVTDSSSTAYSLLYAALGVQEMVLAVWLIVKGFNPSTVAAKSATADTYNEQMSAARESVS